MDPWRTLVDVLVNLVGVLACLLIWKVAKCQPSNSDPKSSLLVVIWGRKLIFLAPPTSHKKEGVRSNWIDGWAGQQECMNYDRPRALLLYRSYSTYVTRVSYLGASVVALLCVS